MPPSVRTKIVATIGPASAELKTLIAMGTNGMDVARMNFSHGDHATHSRSLLKIRQAGARLGQQFGVLQDLQGPKIRVGDLGKGIFLEEGKDVVFTTGPRVHVTGMDRRARQADSSQDIPVTLPDLHRDLRRGARILLDDGLLECKVLRVEGRRIFAEVIHGGMLASHKGMNLPGTKINAPALSEKDRADAAWGIKNGVDFIGLSFIRSPSDVEDLRRLLLKSPSGRNIKIVGKIEKPEAVDRFSKILPLLDVVMVARGDLGVETDATRVPVVQKQIIAACRAKGVPVIVATQMLASMETNPRPTRAEISDVANAVADHADAVMLSGETANGKYPVDAVRVMNETINATEVSRFDDVTLDPSKDGAVARLVSDALHHAPIVVVSPDGQLARAIAATRPETTIHAVTHDAVVARQLRVVWGVAPHVMSAGKKLGISSKLILSALIRSHAVRKKQSIVFIAPDRFEVIRHPSSS